MELNIVSKAKEIATFSEAQFSLILAKMSAEKQNNLNELYSEILELNNFKKPRKINNSIKKTISKEELLIALIKKIDDTLTIYESTPDLDNTDIVAKIGVTDYNKIINEDTKQLVLECHKKLQKIPQVGEQIKLLGFFELGKFYRALRDSAQYRKNWVNFCKNDLIIDSKTVKRYTNFADICESYPRLLICKRSFEEIMYVSDLLIKELRKNDSLSRRLATPLKDKYFSKFTCI